MEFEIQSDMQMVLQIRHSFGGIGHARSSLWRENVILSAVCNLVSDLMGADRSSQKSIRLAEASCCKVLFCYISVVIFQCLLGLSKIIPL